MTPSFQGEVQFRRYSDTSTQGQQVVFAVQGREDLEAFIGKEGKRFMAVLVEIGDDEQPVQETKSRGKLGDLCWRAVQWCADPEFQRWVIEVGDFTNDPSEAVAKNVIQQWCGVESRKELDTNPKAAEKFNRLIRGPYQKHLIARGLA